MATGNQYATYNETIIEISQISLRFAAATALDNINLDIQTGEFFTLLGPSGCGKTSLLRLLAGLQAPTSGHIRLDGQDITGVPPHRRPVNTVFQNYALFPHLSVSRNVAFGLEMLNWNATAIRNRVPEVLALVGLEAYGDRRIDQLSGGQQQRVALARALAPRPRVLLLDEPMSALDLKLRKETQQELKRLHREAGITFILVTHDQEEALTLSDRIAVMKDGRVRQVASPEEIYRKPSDAFVADFIGEANLIQASALGRIGRPGLVMVRPEDVAIVPESEPSRVQGLVSDVRFLGGMVELTVVTDGGVAIRARSAGALALLNHGQAIGRRVGLGWSDAVERELEG